MHTTLKVRVALILITLAVTGPMPSARYTIRGAGENLQAAGKVIAIPGDRNTCYKLRTPLIETGGV